MRSALNLTFPLKYLLHDHKPELNLISQRSIARTRIGFLEAGSNGYRASVHLDKQHGNSFLGLNKNVWRRQDQARMLMCAFYMHSGMGRGVLEFGFLPHCWAHCFVTSYVDPKR